MTTTQLLAEGAGANPLLPNGYEIAVTIFGLLFVVALVVAVVMLIVKLASGTKAQTTASTNREYLQDEIARRTESIEKRLGNIELTFQGVAE